MSTLRERIEAVNEHITAMFDEDEALDASTGQVRRTLILVRVAIRAALAADNSPDFARIEALVRAPDTHEAGEVGVLKRAVLDILAADEPVRDDSACRCYADAQFFAVLPSVNEAKAEVWDRAETAGEAYMNSQWQWSAGHTSRAMNGLTRRPTRPVNPYRDGSAS